MSQNKEKILNLLQELHINHNKEFNLFLENINKSSKDLTKIMMSYINLEDKYLDKILNLLKSVDSLDFYEDIILEITNSKIKIAEEYTNIMNEKLKLKKEKYLKNENITEYVNEQTINYITLLVNAKTKFLINKNTKTDSNLNNFIFNNVVINNMEDNNDLTLAKCNNLDMKYVNELYDDKEIHLLPYLESKRAVYESYDFYNFIKNKVNEKFIKEKNIVLDNFDFKIKEEIEKKFTNVLINLKHISNSMLLKINKYESQQNLIEFKDDFYNKLLLESCLLNNLVPIINKNNIKISQNNVNEHNNLIKKLIILNDKALLNNPNFQLTDKLLNKLEEIKEEINPNININTLNKIEEEKDYSYEAIKTNLNNLYENLNKKEQDLDNFSYKNFINKYDLKKYLKTDMNKIIIEKEHQIMFVEKIKETRNQIHKIKEEIQINNIFLKTYNQISKLNENNDVKTAYKIYNDFKKKLKEKNFKNFNSFDFSKLNLTYEFEKNLELLNEQEKEYKSQMKIKYTDKISEKKVYLKTKQKNLILERQTYIKDKKILESFENRKTEIESEIEIALNLLKESDLSKEDDIIFVKDSIQENKILLENLVKELINVNLINENLKIEHHNQIKDSIQLAELYISDLNLKIEHLKNEILKVQEFIDNNEKNEEQEQKELKIITFNEEIDIINNKTIINQEEEIIEKKTVVNKEINQEVLNEEKKEFRNFIEKTLNKTDIKDLEKLNYYFNLIYGKNILSVSDFVNYYSNNKKLLNELEENQEYNMMILTVCYFLGGQNKYEVTKEFINDTYESKRNYNNHKFDLDLEIKNGFIEFETPLEIKTINEKDIKLETFKVKELLFNWDNENKEISFDMIVINKDGSNEYISGINKKINIYEMPQFFKSQFDNLLKQFKEEKDIKKQQQIFSISSGLEKNKININNINNEFYNLIFRIILEIDKKYKLEYNNLLEEMNNGFPKRNLKEKNKIDLTEEYKQRSRIINNMNYNVVYDNESNDTKRKQNKEITLVRGFYKTIGTGTNRLIPKIIWVDSFYKNIPENMLLNFNDFVKKEETYLVNVSGLELKSKSYKSYIEAIKEIKTENVFKEKYKRREFLVFSLIKYFSQKYTYDNKEKIKSEMNFINGEFIINELQSVYAPLVEKDLVIIKEDRIRLFDFASTRFKNGFEIKNLNEKNNEKGFDYKIINKENGRGLNVSYKFKEGKSFNNTTFNKLTNETISLKESKEEGSFANNLKTSMSDYTLKIDNEIKKNTNIDEIIKLFYKEFIDFCENKNISLNNKDNLKIALKQFNDNNKDYKENTFEYKGEKCYFTNPNDFYSSVKVLMVNYLNKSKDFSINKFNSHIDNYLYLNQNAVVENQYEETKYIVREVYQNKYLNQLLLENKDVNVNIEKDYHQKLMDCVQPVIVNFYKNLKCGKQKLKVLTDLLHLKDEESIILGGTKANKNNTNINNKKITVLPKLNDIAKNIDDIKIEINERFRRVNASVDFDMTIKLGDKILFDFKDIMIKTKRGSMTGTLSVDMSSTKNLFINPELNIILKENLQKYNYILKSNL